MMPRLRRIDTASTRDCFAFHAPDDDDVLASRELALRCPRPHEPLSVVSCGFERRRAIQRRRTGTEGFGALRSDGKSLSPAVFAGQNPVTERRLVLGGHATTQA